MIIEGLITLLKDESSVSTLTSSRVRMSQLEEGDRDAGPSLVLQRAGGTPNQTLTPKTGTRTVQIQIDAYALTRAAAVELSEAVLSFLDYAYGTLSEGTVLQVIRPVGEPLDFYEQDTKLYREFMQFEAWFNAPAASS
jgi:hypothetical protein